MALLDVSVHLLIEDQGLVLSSILVQFASNWFMLWLCAMLFFQRLCPVPFPPVILRYKFVLVQHYCGPEFGTSAPSTI